MEGKNIMKKLLLIFAVLFGAGILHAAAPKGWTTDIEAALKTAGSEKKNVLLLFTGSDWCRYCVRLKNDVLDKDDFQKLCNENFVPVYFDFPSNSSVSAGQMQIQKMWQRKFGVRGYPTVVILKPDGSRIGTIGGYRPLEAYLNALRQYLPQK